MPLTIVTPEQFDAIYQALPDAGAQLLVEAAIETGLRWGELVELRPRDLNLSTKILSVSRVQVEVNPKFHPGGEEFLVRDYPKGKRHRRLKLSMQIVAKLTAHAQRHCLRSDDLYFTVARVGQVTPRLKVIPSPAQLGWRIGTHAVGDRAVRTLLDVYEAVVAQAGEQPPWTLVIEHALLSDPAQRERAVKGGFGVTVQHSLLWNMGSEMLAS